MEPCVRSTSGLLCWAVQSFPNVVRPVQLHGNGNNSTWCVSLEGCQKCSACCYPTVTLFRGLQCVRSTSGLLCWVVQSFPNVVRPVQLHGNGNNNTWRVPLEGCQKRSACCYSVTSDCVEISYAIGVPLVTAYAVVTGGVSLHVRTCIDAYLPHRASVSQKRLDRLCSNLVCGLELGAEVIY